MTESMTAERLAQIRAIAISPLVVELLAEVDRLRGEVERQTVYAKNATDGQKNLMRQHREQRDRADRAEAALARVEALHRQRDDIVHHLTGKPVCDGCGDAEGWASEYPCDTVRAAVRPDPAVLDFGTTTDTHLALANGDLIDPTNGEPR